MARGKIELRRAGLIADLIVQKLTPHCERIEVAGSIRRKRPWVHDIDIVLIPKDLWNIHAVIMQLCSPALMKMSGKMIVRADIGNIPADFYFATSERWATLLLIRTGSTEHNIELATMAKKKGWRLHASGEGLFNELGERIGGDSEESIFRALGLTYVPPEKREV